MSSKHRSKLSEVKNDFINNMTHEFKTPIATISLAHQALSDQDVVRHEDFREKYLGIIGEENKRLERQVEKVLQMAVMERQKLEMKFELIDIHDITRQAITNLKLQVEKKNGYLRESLQAAVSTIVADKVHLTNIIFNLLDNAIKYCKDNPEILLSTRSDHKDVYISVTDRGIGMNNEMQKRIFEKFYRVPTGNVHDVKGFGLGLAYVKNIVDLHGGSITVDSELGKGSTFEIRIPYEKGT